MNLALEVLGRRADGLHEIASVMQTVSLCDELEVTWSDRPDLRCNVQQLVADENLVLKAVSLLQSYLGRPLVASIRLFKRIPIAGGLGGGSSDAAATLVAMSRLAGLTIQTPILQKLALQLGADVPFFLRGGTCLVRGAGEVLQPLRPLVTCRFLLVLPPIAIPNKTKTLYSLLNDHHFTQGEYVLALAEAVKAGQAPPPELLKNTFQEMALRIFPHLHQHWNLARSIVGMEPHLSGTGPCFFFVLRDPTEAASMARSLRARGLTALATRPTRRGHTIRSVAPF